MAIALVQSNNGSGSGTGLQTAKTLGSAPTSGNLLLAFINLGTGTDETSITFDTSKWTPFDVACSSEITLLNVIGLFRYVQPGDTTTLPAFATAGSGFHAWSVLEYSGVTGTWDQDFQGSCYAHSDVGTGAFTTLTVRKFTTQSANVYAILAHAKYNRSASATLSAGWTSDINTNNSGNYGSWGVAHQAVATAGTDIDATVTFQSASDPGGILMVFLQTVVPTKPYIRRFRNYTQASTTAAVALKFGGTVPDNNLMLLCLHWKDGTATSPTGFDTTKWTKIDDSGGATPQMFLYGRIASSETKTWPALVTGGTSFWAATMLEIANPAANVAASVVSTKHGTDTSNATMTTTSDNTLSGDQLAVGIFAEYNDTTRGTDPSGGTTRVDDLYFSDYGRWMAVADRYASGGTTVQYTYTKGNSSANKAAYIQTIFTGVSADVTASGSVPTITMSAPLGIDGETGLGSVGTITLSAPDAAPVITVVGSGSVPTITLTTPTGISSEVGRGPIGTITMSPPAMLKGAATQFGLETVAIGTAQPRLTQFGLEVIAVPSAIARTTQMGLLVLAKGGETPLTPNPLLLQDYGRDQLLYQRMVNMYVEPTPQGPGSSAHFQRPGLYSVAQRGGGPVRCTFTWKGFRFTVSGGSVWRDDENIGVINPNGPARFAFSDEEIVITSNGTPYYVTVNSVTPITSETLTGLNVIDVLFLAGRFIYVIGGTSEFFYSELGDAQNIDGLSFETVDENGADRIIGAVVLVDQIVFFTTKAIEWWYESQDPDAPFQRSPGRRNDRGLASQLSIVKLDNSAFFVGENRIAYRTAAVPQRVSNFSVEDKLRRVGDVDMPNIKAFGVIYGGHSFYVIHLPGQGSWAYDISQNLWAEWKSFGKPFFRVSCADEFGVMGDLYNGDLMGFDGKTYTDKGDSIERVVATYAPIKSGYVKNFNLALDTARGVGISTGYGSDPVVEVRWSDQEGKRWTNWLPASLGMIGDGTDQAKAVWYQLGAIRSPGRLFEFRCSDPVFFAPWQVRFNEPRP